MPGGRCTNDEAMRTSRPSSTRRWRRSRSDSVLASGQAERGHDRAQRPRSRSLTASMVIGIHSPSAPRIRWGSRPPLPGTGVPALEQAHQLAQVVGVHVVGHRPTDQRARVVAGQPGDGPAGEGDGARLASTAHDGLVDVGQDSGPVEPSPAGAPAGCRVRPPTASAPPADVTLIALADSPQVAAQRVGRPLVPQQRGGPGPGEHEALGPVAAQSAQLVELAAGLDPLGHQAQTRGRGRG